MLNIGFGQYIRQQVKSIEDKKVPCNKARIAKLQVLLEREASADSRNKQYWMGRIKQWFRINTQESSAARVIQHHTTNRSIRRQEARDAKKPRRPGQPNKSA